jgi:hypothetical protein
MAEIQDEPFDGAAENILASPDELDLKQDREDRLAAESQGKTAEVEVEGEEFEYETPDGKVVKLSAEQAEAVQSLLDAEERAAALEAKVKALETKPAEEPKPAEAQQDVGGIEPVQWDVVGDNFQAMLEGDQGGVAAIGPALRDVTIRTIATDPVIADIVGRYIDYRVSQREQGVKAETSFKEFVGDEPTDAEITAFRKDNPWANTKALAAVGVKNARLNQEIANLKAGKPAAEKAAKAKGAEETIKSLKAKGTLRRVTSGSAAPRPSDNKPRTENELIQAQVAKIQAMRQGN